MKTTTTTILELTRLARKGGGDRYETILGQPLPNLVIYFPQEISRSDNRPIKRLILTITPEKA